MGLKQDYHKKIKLELAKELNIKNPMAIPRLSKIVINIGAGEAASDKKIIDHIVTDLTQITGQKPIITKARKSISAFKIRMGLAIGVKVTLRGNRMYDFVDKLFKIVLPRIRDFRGINDKSFDGRGNLNIGLSDQTLFPEIEYDKIDKIRGMEITIVTNATDNQSAKSLLTKFGLPFMKTK